MKTNLLHLFRIHVSSTKINALCGKHCKEQNLVNEGDDGAFETDTFKKREYSQ